VLHVILSIIVTFKTIFSHTALPVIQLRTSEERMCMTEEVEKNPSEKMIDVGKLLGLPPSTLNLIAAKKREIREQAGKCGTSAKKRKMSKESTYSKLEMSSLPGTSRPKHQAYLWMGPSCRRNLSK
jgi:hypothetical protein